ncbi:unnamed protein product [Moneuplotes crassus]|uniref:RING-type domain-containing protein n=1 Tax=Euplotes crassus TaxID=5936 RepID=A0AAD2D2D0_EUPCR|nr:unnamed protein product [Moneuplotes crassus]
MNSVDSGLLDDKNMAQDLALIRRPTSINYDQLEAEQERIRDKALSKQYGQTILRYGFYVIMMLICIMASGLDNCEQDIRGLLWLAVMIKGGLCAYYFVAWYLLSSKILKPTLFHIFDVCIFLGLLVFYYHVISLYINKNNSCRDSWNWLWFGHFLLLIESLCSMCMCCCLTCLITFVLSVLCCSSAAGIKKKRADIALGLLLLNAAQFKFNPEDYRSTKSCTICLNDFEQGDNIINLPCHKTHIFHPQCIAVWVMENKNCPLCKTPITEEDINSIEMKETPV